MPVEDLFREGRLEMSAAPLPGLDSPAGWSELLPNRIAVVLSVILVLIFLKDIIRLAPSLLFALDRKRGGESLEYNVSISRMRNTVALIYVLPFCLLADRCAIRHPAFLGPGPAEWGFAAVLGLMLIHFLLRMLSYRLMRPAKLSSEEYSTIRCGFYNYFIALVTVAAPLIGILIRLGVCDEAVQSVFLILTCLAFAFALSRTWQILRGGRSALTTILYLCGLEILPAAAVAASAVFL